jgi:deoxyribonuclease V
MLERLMIACVDVNYRGREAVAGCVVFRDWSDESIVDQCVERIHAPAPYVPGQFYLRELPCILRVLDLLRVSPECILVDGYAWLGHDRPGLGVQLHDVLGRQVPVIGVAKSRFHGNGLAIPVRRGRSVRPLHVTAVGMDAQMAAGHIRQMSGPYRVPNILRQVDRLCRAVSPAGSV